MKSKSLWKDSAVLHQVGVSANLTKLIGSGFNFFTLGVAAGVRQMRLKSVASENGPEL